MANAQNLSYGLLQIAGSNRPGMVADVAKFLHDRGGNIVSSHAVRFGRQTFTAATLFSAPADAYAAIEKDLAALKQYSPHLIPAAAPALEERTGSLLYELGLYSFDHKGIVAEVAALMSAEKLDVVQLASCTYPAPFDGTDMFVVEMVLEAPDHLAAKKAHAHLDALAQHRGWDVYWTPVLKTGVKLNPIAAYPPSRMATVTGPGKAE